MKCFALRVLLTVVMLAVGLMHNARAVESRDYWLQPRYHFGSRVCLLRIKAGWTIVLSHVECTNAQSIDHAVAQVVQHPQIAAGVLMAVAAIHDADKGKGTEIDVLYSGKVASVRPIN